MAYAECGYEFDVTYENDFTRGVPTFLLSPDRQVSNDEPVWTPRIISKDDEVMVGMVNTGRIEAEILTTDGVFKPISKMKRHAKSERISRDIFYSRSIDAQGPFSGIDYRTLSVLQRNDLLGACVKVYFDAFQELDRKNQNVISNHVFHGKKDNCVIMLTS